MKSDLAPPPFFFGFGAPRGSRLNGPNWFWFLSTATREDRPELGFDFFFFPFFLEAALRSLDLEREHCMD